MSLTTLLFVIAVSLKWVGIGTMVSVSWPMIIGCYAGANLVLFGVLYTLATVFGLDIKD